MPIVIKQAQTSKQLIAILEHRHQSRYSKRGRAVDALDILPSTINVLAFENNQILGTARAVHFEPADKVHRTSYDFTESSLKLTGSIGLIDIISLSVNSHSLSTVFEYLIKMNVFLLSLRGYKHIFIHGPNEMSDVLANLGFTTLIQKTDGDRTPMILKVEDFVKRFEGNFADKEILRFKEVFYFSIFNAGEALVTEGERGHTAYVAERGGVDVVVQNNEDLVSISQISTGVLIGEVAMITNEPRTASLVCFQETPCVSFDRGEFFRIMYAEPHRSVEVFKILSRRLSASNKKIAELKKG